jgi:hypothetical protein
MADSSPKKSKGQVKGRGNRKTKQFNCEILEKTIIDKHPVEKAVYCEGSSQSWLHRRCAGLPAKHFKLLPDSSEPFRCYICCQKSFSEELQRLNTKVSNLETKLLSTLPKQNDLHVSIQPDLSTSSQPPQSVLHSSEPRSSTLDSSNNTQHVQTTYATDRKFNLVVYGIQENPIGTPRHVRSTNDLANCLHILNNIHPSMSTNPVRDFTQLDKFAENSTWPRPILLTFVSSIDVANVSSNRKKLSSQSNPNCLHMNAKQSPYF